MASVRKRGNVLHIQWYDPVEDRQTSKSTGMAATEVNRKKAEKYAKELQDELSKRHKGLKQIGVKKISIKYAFEHFLRNNQQKHPKTIYEYKAFYKLLTMHFDENAPCTSLTKVEIEDWLNKIKLLPHKPNTIHTYGKQCVHFINFLFEYNYLAMFKINREVKTKPVIGEKIVFSDDDIVKILEGLSEKNSNFRTAIYLAFYTGLRSSDILTLSVEKIDIEKREMTYYSPKRKKFRQIPFHENLVPILEERMKKVISGLILNYSTIHNLGRAVERYLDKLEIDNKGYSTRTFRKTFITLCRSRYDMDASILRELVGHEHGNTTDRYYNNINMDAMKRELTKFRRPGT